MKKPLLPIGVSNFGKLIRHKDSEGNSYLFMDKSMFIKDFIDSGDEITLITRPRRFGKTINMSMLQHFFAKEVNGIETEGLFNGLKISKHPEVMAYQGKYPVIFLTLKEIRGKDFEEAFERVIEVISKLFKTHRFLIDECPLPKDDKIKFEKILMGKALKFEYEPSLEFLSRLLFEYTKQKPIILLDEYDTPLHDAFINDYYEDMRSFMATMFNKAFKGNDFLYKALITGILKIAKSSLFSELNNVKVYTTLASSKYAHYFGFTEEETVDYLYKAGIPKSIKGLKEMYNGYQINKYILYNPFSIVNFIDEAILLENSEEALKPYWINTGGHGLIKKLIAYNLEQIQSELSDLINKKPLKTTINENVVIGTSLMNSPVSFWSLLLVSGYLKVIEEEKDIRGRSIYTVSFPNEEVRLSMENLMLDLVSSDNSYKYILAMEDLINGNIESFKQFLMDYMRYTPSYFDEDDRYKEQFFHGLILGMTACLSHSHFIKSNRESGKGRYDIALEPKDKDKIGIIIKLKSPSENQDLSKEALSALNQIKELQYEDEMKSKGIKKIINLGIAFRRKEIAIEYKDMI